VINLSNSSSLSSPSLSPLQSLQQHYIKLTVKQKIFIHLLAYTRFIHEFEVPIELTQQGIADTWQIPRTHVTLALIELRREGYVQERRGHVQGLARKRKVYFLTDEGLERARNTKLHLETHKIKFIDEHGNEEILTVQELRGRLNLTLPEILKYLDLHGGVIDVKLIKRHEKPGTAPTPSAETDATRTAPETTIGASGISYELWHDTSDITKWQTTYPESPYYQQYVTYPPTYYYEHEAKDALKYLPAYELKRIVKNNFVLFFIGYIILLAGIVSISLLIVIGTIETILFWLSSSLIGIITGLVILIIPMTQLWEFELYRRRFLELIMMTAAVPIIVWIQWLRASPIDSKDFLIWCLVLSTLLGVLACSKPIPLSLRVDASLVIGTLLITISTLSIIFTVPVLGIAPLWILTGMALMIVGTELKPIALLPLPPPIYVGIGLGIAIWTAATLAYGWVTTLLSHKLVYSLWIIIGALMCFTVLKPPYRYQIITGIQYAIPLSIAILFAFFGIILVVIAKPLEGLIELFLAGMIITYQLVRQKSTTQSSENVTIITMIVTLFIVITVALTLILTYPYIAIS
jgi:DNA-binding PadR family transcriptional regulator